ncbi:MAG: hypothetical protein HY819_06395 [Acidobacteria bacterium]|nr:hypothetical protein [Acidobacteriota bacterium]
MLDKSDKSDKSDKPNISVGSFLAKFFAFITVGGVFLSLGAVGLYRLLSNLPLSISPIIVVFSLIIGLVLDILAILYFLRYREKIFSELFKDK